MMREQSSLLTNYSKETMIARWTPALSNKWGCLAQSNDAGVASTYTIDFIDHTLILKNKKFTYGSFACNHRLLKAEEWKIHIVVGGDKSPCNRDIGLPAANMLETKLLFYSVIFNAKDGAQFTGMDLENMFLQTPMKNAEYMNMAFKYFPEDIRQRYNLYNLVHDGYIYIKIKKGCMASNRQPYLPTKCCQKL